MGPNGLQKWHFIVGHPLKNLMPFFYAQNIKIRPISDQIFTFLFTMEIDR